MFNPDPAPVFPACPTYGFTTSPDYLVKYIAREGGFERIDIKWEEPLHTYSGTPLGNRPQRDIERVLYFYHALKKGNRFRFKDWADYKSCILDNDPTPLDQPLQLAAGSPSGYQLTKQYVAADFVTIRTIYRPKANTIRIANGAGVEQAATTWTLEESTGLVTPGLGFTGTPATWGGEFDVWCRFDGAPQLQILDFKIQTATINLKEVRPNP
jgi:uncharacterized protein (TIGR02217 family)